MSVVNNFLPFCTNDSNVPSQSAYAADSARTNGNVPGIANSTLNNKAIRQGTYVVSQLAQFLANTTNQSVLDNTTPAQLLAQLVAALKFYTPVISSLTTGTGTFALTYIFEIATTVVAPTATATYSDGVTTYTVSSTVTGLELYATGSTAPVTGGSAQTLTKLTGTGDATVTYYAVRAPKNMQVLIVGGGGGGASGGGTHNAGTDGSDSTFGASGTLLTAKGGKGGPTATNSGALNTTASIGASATGFIVHGSGGGGSTDGASVASLAGGQGGASMLGGGAPSPGTNVGVAAAANSGGGGSGAGVGGNISGGGGNGGEGISAWYEPPSGTYAWAVGAGGAGGTGTVAGGAGGSGLIVVIQNYQ